MQESFENPSEIIFFMPKSQFRWIYKIDNGRQHIIHQDDLINFIRKYIDKKYISDVRDIMLRHQPFIVLIEDKKVVELHKEDDTIIEYHNRLSTEIDNVLKYSNEKKSQKNIYDERFNDLINNFTKM